MTCHEPYIYGCPIRTFTFTYRNIFAGIIFLSEIKQRSYTLVNAIMSCFTLCTGQGGLWGITGGNAGRIPTRYYQYQVRRRAAPSRLAWSNSRSHLTSRSILSCLDRCLLVLRCDISSPTPTSFPNTGFSLGGLALCIFLRRHTHSWIMPEAVTLRPDFGNAA